MFFFLLILQVALVTSTTLVRDRKDVQFTSSLMPVDSEVTSNQGTRTADDQGEGCRCVSYYLCTSEEQIIPETFVDYRTREPIKECPSFIDVCCKEENIHSIEKRQIPTSRVKECGYRNPEGFGKSFQGTGQESKFGEFPWVVALLNADNSTYEGAGVIISPDVVMTGAHKVRKYLNGTLKIRAGEWDTQTVNEIFKHQERDVEEIMVHEDYQQTSLKNNIALLRLSRPLQLGNHINALCLPEQDEMFDNRKNCVSNGWGKDLFGRNGRYTVILRKSEQDMVPHQQCEDLLKKTRLGSSFNLHDSFVCASEQGKDYCTADGGAALACPISDNRYKLTGLVAWGIGCGQENIPAVYTNVPKFRRWVDDKLSNWGLLNKNF